MKIEITSNPIKHYFKCTKCGICCASTVELTYDEYKRIKQLSIEKRISIPIEIRDYITIIKYIMKPIEIENIRKCVFLMDLGSEKICSIYDQRPTYCRLYPLYPGYSSIEDKLYVDILHCPYTLHEFKEDFQEINDKFIIEVLKDVEEHEPNYLTIIPNLDREVVLLQQDSKVYLVPMYIKYKIVQIINNTIVNQLKDLTNFIEFIRSILDIQYQLRDLIIKISNIEKLPEFLSNELVIGKYPVSDNECIYMIKTVLNDLGIKSSGSVYVVYDNINRKLCKVEFSDNKICKLSISELNDFIYEIFRRFAINYQIYYLPLEMIYSHGYLILFSLLSLYLMLDLENLYEYMCVYDCTGLPIVFKYVTTLVKNLHVYSSSPYLTYTYLEHLV